MDERLERLLSAFRGRIPGEPEVVRAPGRVNLIGEHTDYNDGFVLPIAIERDVRIAFKPRTDRQVRLYSLDFGQESTFSLDDIRRSSEAPWSNYARGMAQVLERHGKTLTETVRMRPDAGLRLRGMDAVIEGNVPLGAGLSSSAALELAAGLALLTAADLHLLMSELAPLAQRAENEFVGVRCGIMDQFISAVGQAGHALMLDCRSLAQLHVPIPGSEWVFVVADSQQSRELAGSAYNVRRAECEAAVAVLSGIRPGIRALRDVTEQELRTRRNLLDPTVYRRARHVVTENERVRRATFALSYAGSEEVGVRKKPPARRAHSLVIDGWADFGELMNASHDSLRDDYEVSSPALDALVEAARAVPGCAGSRLTGAGFGGCTVSLVRRDSVEQFSASVRESYQRSHSLEPLIYVTAAADGAGPMETYRA